MRSYRSGNFEVRDIFILLLIELPYCLDSKIQYFPTSEFLKSEFVLHLMGSGTNWAKEGRGKRGAEKIT